MEGDGEQGRNGEEPVMPMRSGSGLGLSWGTHIGRLSFGLVVPPKAGRRALLENLVVRAGEAALDGALPVFELRGHRLDDCRLRRSEIVLLVRIGD